VPDGCDVCPGGDDRIDSDGDTLPDLCDCEGVTCDENATCYNTEEGPVCVCDDGYEGDGFTCTDVDECALGTDTCDVHATCTNTPGSYTCACDSGYSGDGHTCTDVNECTTGTHTCHMYATCTNTDGGYTCTCNPGYSGDGHTCTPIDHCSAGTDLCDAHAICTYTGPGTYTCTCSPGYSGDGFTCAPIDHCTAGTHLCDPHATCRYTGPGTYTCSCNSGYSGDGFTCTPIDHCSAGTDLCDPHATCTYTGPGTYTCTCNSGYTGDGFTCTPVSGGGSGHMVVIGHDYYASNTYADDLIGNAVFQLTTGHVDMLAYTQYSDMVTEKPHTDSAIEQRRIELGRTLTRTEMSSYTLLGTGIYDLALYDVLLIYEQETGTTAIMDTIAAAWDSRLDAFLAAGGVIVVSDGYCGGYGGGGSRILYSAGLLDVTSLGFTSSTGTLTVVTSTDPVATGIPSTYTATNSTNYYGTPTSWNVVVQDSTGMPICLTWHGSSSTGHAVMIGHDYFSSNASMDAIVGNAVLLANTTGTINVLGYTQYADTSGEVPNTQAAITGRASALGRTVSFVTPLTDYTQLATRLPGNHVLLIYEMELGGSGSTIGAAWASTLDSFVRSGGVVIACNYFDTSWQIMNSSGLMGITAQASAYSMSIVVADSTDPVAAGVTSPYTGMSGSSQYTTTETGVVTRVSGGNPVVIHKTFP
jgi:hypothetical protein